VKRSTAILAAVLVGPGLLALSGCSSLGAKPWQRAALSRPDMQVDADAVQAGLDDHIYFSKEASSGGRGFGGGGCGCN
jgi:hypothetical protein